MHGGPREKMCHYVKCVIGEKEGQGGRNALKMGKFWFVDIGFGRIASSHTLSKYTHTICCLTRAVIGEEHLIINTL